MPRYLEKRRRRWYAVLDIPKDVRHKFNGKPRFIESLKTESQSEAEVLVMPLIAEWKTAISEARGRKRTHLGNISERALAWRAALKESQDQRAYDDDTEHFALASALDDELHTLALVDPTAADIAAKIIAHKSYPLNRDVEAWLATQSLAPKTIDMKRSDLSRFLKQFEFSHQVTRPALIQWLTNLKMEARLKQATLGRITSTCRGYWLYLHDMGYIAKSEGLFDRIATKNKANKKTSQQTSRLAFSKADIPRLINGAITNKHTQLAQLIWFAALTGCRIEELCSLKRADLHDRYFSVSDSKTAAGIREVPIHPRLRPMIKHLCEKEGDEYVFSGLTFNKYSNRSNAIGKSFGRLKRALGYGPRHVFHSIRHTVVTELENAGVPENITADIVGHEKPTLTYGLYSKGNRIEILEKAIKHLNYELPPEVEKRMMS